MWCNFGLMGRGMWGPHGFGFIVPILILALIIYVIYLVLKRLKSAPGLKCPGCNGQVQPAFLRCPHCGATLKNHCPHCSAIIEAGWKYCPACEGKTSE